MDYVLIALVALLAILIIASVSTAFFDPIRKYFDFKGLATRREYWSFLIITQGSITLIAFAIDEIAGPFFSGFLNESFTVDNVFSLFLAIPTISCGARRMHDVGKSGWFQLVPVYNIYLLLKRSNPASTAHNNDEDLIDSSVNEENEMQTFTKTPSYKFIAVLALIPILFSVSAVYLALGPWLQFRETDPVADGYVQPRSVAKIVASTQKSTVTIYCSNSEGGVQGSAWASDIELETYFPSVLVTNYHVIKDCLGDSNILEIARFTNGKYKIFPAEIYNWDKKLDLALLTSDMRIKPLMLSKAEPRPGYWVMAVGSPQDREDSVSFGNVINITNTKILSSVPLTSGNSGGPLVDNEGYVVGTNTAVSARFKVQWNFSMSLDAMCRTFLKCDGKFYWD